MNEAEAKIRLTIRKKNFMIRTLYKVRKWFRGIFVPNIFDIMMQSMQTMQYEVAEVSCKDADVVIRPTHIHADWFEFFDAKKFVRRGEEETMHHLPKIRSLVFGEQPQEEKQIEVL